MDIIYFFKVILVNLGVRVFSFNIHFTTTSKAVVLNKPDKNRG